VVLVPYSLVNVPALGYDLARLPRGDQVARVLRASLACGPREVARLSARHPGVAREARWQEALAAGSGYGVRSTLELADRAIELAQAGDPGSSTVLLRRLELAALGDLPALERMVRHEILDRTSLRTDDLTGLDQDHTRAADVLVDAAAAAYCSGGLSDPVRRAMSAPFLTSRVEVGAATGHPGVDAILARVAGSDEADRSAWRRAASELRPSTQSWAPAMHQATWALHLTDRLRLAADAQLAAVVTFREAGFDPRDAAYGVWNALSGTIQAAVAGDLLPDAEMLTLTAVWSSLTTGDGPAGD